MISQFAGYSITRDNFGHFAGRLDKRLVFPRCCDCFAFNNPPRAICSHCWSTKLTDEEVTGRGTVRLETIVHIGPDVPGVDYKAGHPIVVVELVEQPGLYFGATIFPPHQGIVGVDSDVELRWVLRDSTPVPTFGARGEST